MEQTPYLKTEIPDNLVTITEKLRAKMQFLSDVQQAVAEDNDRLVYKLLNTKKVCSIN